MPSPPTDLPLFTMRYALRPSIILCMTEGIRPYALCHQWAGWGSEENQWMTRDELTNCNHVLQSWLNKARLPIFSRRRGVAGG